jgi:phosphoribosylformylglycinamidine synthase
MAGQLLRFYRRPALSTAQGERVREEVAKHARNGGVVASELCFYVATNSHLTDRELSVLRWLFGETFEPHNFSASPFLPQEGVVEIGPRLSFETAWSSNAVSVLRGCGIHAVDRTERALRLALPTTLDSQSREEIAAPLHDRMTQMVYPQPLTSFESGMSVAPVCTIPLLQWGEEALRYVSRKMGLGWDDQDIEIIGHLFADTLGRNPTDVELFQIGQANSEHSRHPFFRGQLVIDGVAVETSLLEIVMAPWRADPGNSLVAFADDSSAIRGGPVPILLPTRPGEPSPLLLKVRVLHPTLTAETHNHPSGIEPYEGAATGTGGRVRDNFSTGRGALVVVGAIGYCVAYLHIPGYPLPWEKGDARNPPNMASPLDILIRASDGASDYGNCFGEPVLLGFTRTWADANSGWIKPVLYTAGAGQIDDEHLHKDAPEKGILVVQIGGPAYRIGVGGASASSMVTGENLAELDFASVQRGDPEMEQKLYRVVRACVEMGSDNPTVSSRDLGAGGDCNAVQEIVYPAGARIRLRSIPVGDKTLSVLEIWGNESQERVCLLIRPDKLELLQKIAEREGTPCAVVGEITGDGRLVVEDEQDGSTPVDLPLEELLGESAKKTSNLQRVPIELAPLKLPDSLTVAEALDRVLRLPSVGSKGFLTRKVDRSVGGLVAQQQCVGPNQLTLSDYAVNAQSHFADTGTALSIGEQPIKGLISPAAMARMAVAEALLNMVGARITDRRDIRCSANWMWPAKLPGEGARLYDAAIAMRDIMFELGIAVDGGKDSLSMAANTTGEDGQKVTVKAPGQLVIGAYATMKDVDRKVTPDFKRTGNSVLFVDLAPGKNRLGGSALAQVYQQIGDECPDVEDAEQLKSAFDAVQERVANHQICSLHDRSDGGLVTTLLEMAFAGDVGLEVSIPSDEAAIPTLFSEELGFVAECVDGESVAAFLEEKGVPVQAIGRVGECAGQIKIRHNGDLVLDQPMTQLRAIWEETSTRIDLLQANPDCVNQESAVCRELVTPPPFTLTFDPAQTPPELLLRNAKPKWAVLRDEGTNGDREMAAAFLAAGFQPWDVLTQDIAKGEVSLSDFVGVTPAGGFAHKDVPEAAVGWAASILFNGGVREEFERFFARSDTLSLGVCNGCQLAAILGWAPWGDLPDSEKPRFVGNTSERFESRFVTVEISPSPSVFFRGMEGSRLGVWVAHRVGRLQISEEKLNELQRQNLCPVRFVDPTGESTTVYPFNPNGSPEGITGICSPDGRHLAMMPHPERLANKLWQWPWLPPGWERLEASPWLHLFQNAYKWCSGS